MEIYAAIIFSLGIFNMGIQSRNGAAEFTTAAIGMLIGLPIYGRIFGWW